jgi:hypothetical protein
MSRAQDQHLCVRCDAGHDESHCFIQILAWCSPYKLLAKLALGSWAQVSNIIPALPCSRFAAGIDEFAAGFRLRPLGP